eukprot:c19165_g1_i2.p1 GENE.c19165_g1_i2~~c19165_g1_i2.p1  ORF type:complete len:299 (-),score=51.72 c19165_g1_i2:777-1673(-)
MAAQQTRANLQSPRWVVLVVGLPKSEPRAGNDTLPTGYSEHTKHMMLLNIGGTISSLSSITHSFLSVEALPSSAARKSYQDSIVLDTDVCACICFASTLATFIVSLTSALISVNISGLIPLWSAALERRRGVAWWHPNQPCIDAFVIAYSLFAAAGCTIWSLAPGALPLLTSSTVLCFIPAQPQMMVLPLFSVPLVATAGIACYAAVVCNRHLVAPAPMTEVITFTPNSTRTSDTLFCVLVAILNAGHVAVIIASSVLSNERATLALAGIISAQVWPPPSLCFCCCGKEIECVSTRCM